MAKKVESTVETINTDLSKLISSVSKDIAKEFDDFDIDKVDEQQQYLSTGNSGINYAFSGKFDGGFPVGKLTELSGLNSTGKTLLALHALVETQKKGGIAVILDAEYAFNPEWFKTLGGNLDTLIRYEPQHIQGVYAFVKKVTESIRARDKNILITMVYDSVAASPSQAEFEGAEHDMGKRALAHGKGIRMLMGLCSTHKITFIAINQLRQKMNVMYGPDMETTGGQGWKYGTSLRVSMRKGKKIEVKEGGIEKVVGIHGNLTVDKNRFRSPFARAEFDIYFDQGIDPVSGLFDVLVAEQIVTQRKNEDGGGVKGWWTYKDMNFQKSNFDAVLDKYPELCGGHKRIKGYSNTVVEDDGVDSSGDSDSTEADM